MALRRRLAPIVLASLVAVVVPASAAALVHVPRGQAVKGIRVVGNSVRVDGRATGLTVVVDGDLVVGRSGTVDDATVIGGRIRTEPGATLNGDIFQLGGSWPHLGGWQLALLTLALLTIRLVVVRLVVTAADVLVHRQMLEAVALAARARVLRTFLVGVLAAFGLSAIGVLLALSLFGLALAAAVLAVLVVATVVGVALALASFEGEPRGRGVIYGALALPVLGDGAAMLAAIVGLGALLRYAADARADLAGRRSPLVR